MLSGTNRRVKAVWSDIRSLTVGAAVRRCMPRAQPHRARSIDRRHGEAVAAYACRCSRFRLLLADEVSTLMAGRATAGRPRSNRPQHGGKQMAMKLEDYANK